MKRESNSHAEKGR